MLSMFVMVGKAAYTARKVVMAMISPCNASVCCSECNNETLHSHFLCQIRAACKVFNALQRLVLVQSQSKLCLQGEIKAGMLLQNNP